ncbi:Phosphoglucosamine mutase [Frankliniella fusca]|uniref:Phosphoglucosamine mutase n=1 Tax=Frankliniella fusca TaxID=407009 RepID=A0AAE1HSR5_9NEOP|nr:Phosphoglucosamine mutase [Frankliniella fusca]
MEWPREVSYKFQSRTSNYRWRKRKLLAIIPETDGGEVLQSKRINLQSQPPSPTQSTWGPLHAYTTFNFESYNQKPLAKIKSPKDAVKQVVTRHLLQLCVCAACNHQQPHISEEIRQELLSIISKPRRQNVQVFDGVTLLSVGEQRRPTQDEVECLEREGFVRSMQFGRE